MKQASCVFVVLLMAANAMAAPTDDKDVQKVLKTLITSIKYKKDDVAAKQIAFGPMSETLFGDAWKTMSDADKKEVTQGVEKLIRTISFAKGREMFEYLDAVLYDPVRLTGEMARCKSTVVVHRNYKKTEILIDWKLVKQGGSWRVVDTVMLGQSTAEGIREDQVQPLLAEGGVPKVMQALRTKLQELNSKK